MFLIKISQLEYINALYYILTSCCLALLIYHNRELFSMNNKLPIFIAATIGLSILTTSISVNSAIARSAYESGYGGWDLEEWAQGEQGQ
jgi:hypothetical protein